METDDGMTRDCGAWINLLAHQVKKRMNATLSDLGITGVQSRVMHYILEHGQDGPVFQRDVEAAFNLSRSTTTNILQLMEKNGIIRREGVDYDAHLKRLVPTEKAVQIKVYENYFQITLIRSLPSSHCHSGDRQLFCHKGAPDVHRRHCIVSTGNDDRKNSQSGEFHPL